MVHVRHVLPVHRQQLIVDVELVTLLSRAAWDETTCERREGGRRERGREGGGKEGGREGGGEEDWRSFC